MAVRRRHGRPPDDLGGGRAPAVQGLAPLAEQVLQGLAWKEGGRERPTHKTSPFLLKGHVTTIEVTRGLQDFHLSVKYILKDFHLSAPP